MTPAELAVLDCLLAAHNQFIALPIQHPDDHDEWSGSMHELQRIVMAREAVRSHPDIFVNEALDKEIEGAK
jgi:hypothetical protein